MAFDRQIGSLTIYCEASNASYSEKVAVAWVIRNRVNKGFGKTVSAVCLKRMQFSEWNGDIVDNTNLERAANTPDDDRVLQDCLSAYDWAFNSKSVDITQGATHYHDKSINPPAWTVGATKTLETNKFIFYKDVK
jgi:spore germination cell wall hydrolase CwlJ-like protein